MCRKLICLILFTLVLGITEAQAQGATWDRAAYWDGRYPMGWGGDGVAMRDALQAAGYTILNADQLKTWMDARIADKALSVVVFCRDIAPDTVAETMSSSCTLRKYLDEGGKIVWYADIPFYYQGHSNGTQVTWGDAGAPAILGFNTSSAPRDSYNTVTLTATGIAWGLTQTWQSQRPAAAGITDNFEILATDLSGNAPAWVKHYVAGDRYRGFVRLRDTTGGADSGDVMRVAETRYFFKASTPSPADGGELEATEVSLGWIPGDLAAQHDVYFGENLNDVINANTSTAGIYKGRQSEIWYPQDPFETIPLTQGKTYYWRIDEVNDLHPDKLWRGNTWSFIVKPVIAYRPSPPDGGIFVPLGVTLHWRAGLGAKKFHTVYFATNFNDVNNAPLFSVAPPWKANLTVPRSDPNWTTGTNTNTLNKTYYWRVDEIESTSPKIGYKGKVWSFTTTRAGGGLRGDYYDNMDFTAFVLSRIDPQINFSWGAGSPAPSIGVDTFTVRWTGEIEIPPASGDYTFTTNTDDGVRLWVNDQLVVNSWIDQGATNHSGTIYLVGGQKYSIQMDYYENGGDAVAYLYWQGPTTSYGLVPQAAFSPPLRASTPDPADGTDDVPLSGTLGWTAGTYALSHDVYIGTKYSDVNVATTSSHPNVQYYNRTVNNCPIGPLSSGTVYYWRVDEVNNLPPNNGLWKGRIWLFRTVGGGGGLLGMFYHWPTNAVSPPNPPEVAFTTFVMSRIDRTVNFNWGDGTAGTPGSPAPGIVNLDRFACKWIGAVEAPVAGKYTFSTTTDDGARLFIDGQLVISNAWLEQAPTEWSSPQLDLTAGWHDIEMQQYENGGGAAAELRWAGPIMTRQIIPAWYLSPPLKASVPLPYDGDPEAPPTVILSWRRGDKAAKHDVYFGTDFNDVNEATTSSPPSIYRGRRDPNTYDPPEQLEMGQTYYWRVDEVNLPNIWPGDVWSFTVANYLVLEDYERYTNTSPLKIFETWIAAGGGKAGYSDPNYAELSIIHGGRQSMPFDYSNLSPPNYSEASRTFTTSQDWTVYGVKALSLWLEGYPVSVGSFVENPAGVYTMTARGADIWDVPDLRRPSRFHDEFHYAYWQVSGDYAITAKVESMTNTNVWAKAGVMIRDSIDANSAHGMTCLTPDPVNGIALQHRAVAGGVSTADFNMPNINPPYWVGLKRYGGTSFTALYSPDGSNWSTLSSTSITLTDPVCIGLSLTAHNTAATCTAVFSDVHLYTVNPDNSVTEVTPLPAWTSHQDIGIKSNVAAPVYVTLQDSGARTATVTHDDPNIVLATAWTAWGIPLARFTSLNPNLDLTKIQKLTVGVGNKGTGTIYVDDIRLYTPQCIAGLPGPQADFNGDCIVNYADLAVLTNNWLVSEYLVNPAAPPPYDPNLELWYQFENNLLDSSGKGRNGDPCGAPTYAAGKIGQALSINGGDSVDTHVTASAMKIGGNKPKTVTAWVYTRDFNDGGIFDVGDNVNGQNFSLRTYTPDNTWRAQRFGWPTYDFDVVYPSLNTWVHMALVYDGSKAGNHSWVYADGICVGTQTIELNTTNTRTFQIGLWSGNYFNGLIDDLRVYSRALSQPEVAYLAGKTASFTQPLKPLLMPQNTTTLEGPPVNMYDDSIIDFRDYAVLASTWLEELLWPPPMMNVWGYEFKNDANCYNVGDHPKEARDLHLQFADVIYLVDTGPFTTFAGNETSKITLSGGTVPANGSIKIRVGSTGAPRTLVKWWWTDALGQRIGKEMPGVGLSCKQIN